MSSSLPLPKFIVPTAIGIGVLALVIQARPFLYVTEPGSATVIFNAFSGLQKDRVEKPGVTLITPLIDRPITYNVRTKVWEFTDDPNSFNQASNAITVNTADGQAFTVDVSIALKPNEVTLDNLHAEIGQNYMATVVVPVVRSKFRDISAGFESEDFYQKERRTEIEQKATDLIRQEMPTADVNGAPVPLILIESIFVGTANFPPALKDSIEQRQVASITAQTARVRAEIQDKETQRLLILAEANQRAIELKGQAAAKNAELADLLFYERLEDRIRRARAAGDPPPLGVIRIEGDSTVFLNVDPQKAMAVTTSQPQQ
ncbi:MAG: prohibitin family protein [Cyanobacteriota bacterium]|nr:prohibitin family protein [Cyanobacteriota bacterium]